MSQLQPDPGWYPDPAGTGGVRWWDGFGWTEHVADGSAEADPDDGELRKRPRDQVFAGAMRGVVPTIAERTKLGVDALVSLRGVQLAGVAAVTMLCWWIGVRAIPGGNGMVAGAAIWFGIALPIAMWLLLREQARHAWWLHWCASRGFTPGAAAGSASVLPTRLARSPLLGAAERRVIERVAVRDLCGRRAVLGSVLHLDAGADPRRAPVVHRSTFIILHMPSEAADRWPGACIRADHHARRPMALRSMLGALVARAGIPGAHAHVSAQPTQAQHVVAALADDRLERFLARNPLDADLVEELLVVTRDGLIEATEELEELCRDALVLHELVVAEHELPAAREAAKAAQAAARAEQLRAQADDDGWSLAA